MPDSLLTCQSITCDRTQTVSIVSPLSILFSRRRHPCDNFFDRNRRDHDVDRRSSQAENQGLFQRVPRRTRGLRLRFSDVGHTLHRNYKPKPVVRRRKSLFRLVVVVRTLTDL